MACTKLGTEAQLNYGVRSTIVEAPPGLPLNEFICAILGSTLIFTHNQHLLATTIDTHISAWRAVIVAVTVLIRDMR
jgi:hypothetical protein